MLNKAEYIDDNNGFTMVELVIFLTIVSLLLSSALLEYSKFKREKIFSDTEAHKTKVSDSLSAFIGNFGRLPCPADPTLPATDPMAGVEQCLCPRPPAVETPPNCPRPMPVVPSSLGGVNRVEGFRDTPSDPETMKGSVLIGSVPYVTLGITHNDTMDGWGSTFTYAVTENLTILERFNANNGVIQKMFRSTVTPVGVGGDIFPELAKIDPVNTANAFMIALISHGKDRRGGYSYDGNLIATCDVAALDGENCDGDATFLSADRGTEIYNLVPGPLYYDDWIGVFTVTLDGDKWAYTSNTAIENKAGGKVGIGISPAFTLHINNGDLLSEGRYKSSDYCDEFGANCFDPDIIAGAGINCGSNGFMTGVSSENTTCVNKIDPTLLITGSCPVNQYMIGIDAGGNILCTTP